jgi:mono/diheme cytochrome c family protein
MRYRIMRVMIVLGGVWAIMVGGQTVAQERAVQGHALARQWCAACHMVEPGGTAASDAAPPFAMIAQDQRLTPDQLRAWLAAPHPPMPNLSLSRDEITNLIAYIKSLSAP